MSTATITLLLLAGGTYALKSAAPLVLSGRALPTPVQRVTELLPVGLLAALTLVSTVTVGTALSLDARAVGVAAAAIALWRRVPFVFVVLVAVASTALTRSLA